MASRQSIRAAETRGAILTAAGQLFAKRGFDAVTMREIAGEAGCSHTTIYIYFQDKEALLHQLAMEPLQGLRERMESMLRDPELSPEERLRRLSQVFIRFGLENRTLYSIFFMAMASRVDLPAPGMPIQQLRNDLFGLLRQAVQEYLGLEPDGEQALAYARIAFYTLHGILGLYTPSDEPLDALMARLGSTFDLTIEVMLSGFRQTMTKGEGRP